MSHFSLLLFFLLIYFFDTFFCSLKYNHKKCDFTVLLRTQKKRLHLCGTSFEVQTECFCGGALCGCCYKMIKKRCSNGPKIAFSRLKSGPKKHQQMTQKTPSQTTLMNSVYYMFSCVILSDHFLVFSIDLDINR